MKKFYILLCICLSFKTLFALNTAADWLILFNQYKNGNNFGINQGGVRVNTDFYNAMYTYSNRTAIVIPYENTFEEFGMGLNILVSMYEATSDVTYLEKVLDYSENLIDNAHLLNSSELNAGYKEIFGVSLNYEGWNQGSSGENSTEEIKPFRYVLKLCRIIAAKPTLYANYQTRVNALVAFI